MWGVHWPGARTNNQSGRGRPYAIYVTNKLLEANSIHWHGIILPSGMDGVAEPKNQVLTIPVATSVPTLTTPRTEIHASRRRMTAAVHSSPRAVRTAVSLTKV